MSATPPSSRRPTKSVVTLPLPPGAKTSLESVRQILVENGPLVPHDSVLLVAIWPTSSPPAVSSLTVHIDALLHRGLLRRVIVGSEPHLALPRPFRALQNEENQPASEVSHPLDSNRLIPEETPESTPEPPVEPLGENETTRTTEQNDEKEFSLRLEVDAETERVLLYRVTVVLMAMGALTILREWVLYVFHL